MKTKEVSHNKEAIKKVHFKEPKPERGLTRLDYKKEVECAGIKLFCASLHGCHLLIKPGASEKASMEIQWPEKNHLPEFSLTVKDSTLYLKSSNLTQFIEKDLCTILITLPRSMNIKVRFSIGGTLFIDQMMGNLDVSITTGTVTGNVFAKKVDIDLKAGDINLHCLQGSAKIRTESGNIDLIFHKITRRDKINLKCRMTGNIKVRFPYGFLLNENTKKSHQIQNVIGADVKLHTKLGKIKVDMAGIPRQFSEFPKDILLNIFGFFSPKELSIAGGVCRRWHEIARDDSLWKNFCKSASSPNGNSSLISTWKQSYLDSVKPKSRKNNAETVETVETITYFQQNKLPVVTVTPLLIPAVSMTAITDPSSCKIA